MINTCVGALFVGGIGAVCAKYLFEINDWGYCAILGFLVLFFSFFFLVFFFLIGVCTDWIREYNDSDGSSFVQCLCNLCVSC